MDIWNKGVEMAGIWDEIREFSGDSLPAFQRAGNILHWQRAIISIIRGPTFIRGNGCADPLHIVIFQDQIAEARKELEDAVGYSETVCLLTKIVIDAKRQVDEEEYCWFEQQREEEGIE